MEKEEEVEEKEEEWEETEKQVNQKWLIDSLKSGPRAEGRP